jgi:DNA oxidative demethylase
MRAEQADLFADAGAVLPLADGACVLRAFALPRAPMLLEALARVIAGAPWRHMTVPGGQRMSVAMSNAGSLGWTSDARGYRYAALDPLSGMPWPPLPLAFSQLARDAAARAGFEDFAPDACLVNRYAPGARLSLHQDRDERDFTQPIVSVSLGLPALFLFGGPKRAHPTRAVPLQHGDVVVWGGASRLHFHGVRPLADGEHPATGRCRINLTLRCAG